MIVVMIIALAVSNVFLYGKEIKVEEGFDTSENSKSNVVDDIQLNEKVEEKLKKMMSDSSSDKSSSKENDKDTEKTEETRKTSTTKKPEPTSAQVENAKADLKGLLELEIKLMQSVSEMQPLLDKAKDTIERLKKNVESTSSA
jgi:hypothetical protein